ncbi:MAG: hypothetical protein ACE145_18110 [Terriglobia bacterium]
MPNILGGRRDLGADGRARRVEDFRPERSVGPRVEAGICELSSAGPFEILYPISNTVRMLVALATRLPGGANSQGGRTCVVAGYLGSEAQWLKFIPRWQTVLSAAGVGAFEAACERGQGALAGWAASERAGLLQRLTAVLRESGLEPVGSALPLDEFEALSVADRESLTGGRPDDPHLVCFNQCLVEAARRAAPLPRHEKVSFVLDWSDGIGSAALWHFEDLKCRTSQSVRERLGALGFESRRAFPPLQAAELGACEPPLRPADSGWRNVFPEH